MNECVPKTRGKNLIRDDEEKGERERGKKHSLTYCPVFIFPSSERKEAKSRNHVHVHSIKKEFLSCRTVKCIEKLAENEIGVV